MLEHIWKEVKVKFTIKLNPIYLSPTFTNDGATSPPNHTKTPAETERRN